MWLAIAVLAALRKRDAAGTGNRISVSLYDTALSWNAYHLIGYHSDGTVPRPMGSEMPMIAPYGAFPTSDGRIMIAAANDGLFARLCTALGLGPLYADRRYATNPLRVSRRAELNALVARGTFAHTSAALLQLLRDVRIPCAPIQDISMVAADPQTQASGMVVDVADGTAVALPIRWDGERFDVGSAPPAAGSDTDDVIREL
jgi:crotonobetainyl-CoA:carnitine CoA-transferase CaiB-like acyl-CoA transferase